MAVDKLPTALEGRNLTTQQVSFIRRDISAKEKNLSVRVGILPRGAVITSIKCYVRDIFSDAKLKLGSSEGGQEYGEKEIKTKGIQDYTLSDSKFFVPLDKETSIFAKRDKSTASGECSVIITFVANR